MARTVRRRTPRRPLTRRQIVLSIVGGVLLLLIIVGLVFWARLTGGPALPRPVRERMEAARATGPAAAPADAPAAPGTTGAGPSGSTASSPSAGTPVGVPAGTPSFPQQVQQVQAAAQSGDTTSRTMYITDAELSDQLTAEIRKHPEVQEARGFFESGKAYLTARVNAKGRDLNLTMVLRPTVADGTVRFDVDQVFVGRVAAPPAVAQKVQEEISKRAAWFTPDRTGLYVDMIEIRSGLAVLTGRPAPRQT